MAEALNAKGAGRLAGLAYLAVIVFAAPGYMILTGLLAGGPQADLARLATSQAQLILALASSAIGFAAWAALAILLYRLMRSAGQVAGLLMLILAVAGVAANLFALSQLLPLVGSDMDAATVAPIVQSYKRLLLLSQVFSGVWLFPFGWLVLRSRVAPRILAFGLLAGGIFYSMIFATAFDPGIEHTMIYRILRPVTGVFGEVVGEMGICLWFLIKGAAQPDAARLRPVRPAPAARTGALGRAAPAR